MLRMSEVYVDPTGRLTQAGWQAIQGELTADETAIAALDTRLDAVEEELAGSLITPATAVTLTTQTDVDFTGIPSWVRRVTVTGRGVSTNGTNLVIIRVGDGAIVSTGYLGAASQMAAAVTSTNGTTSVPLMVSNAAANVFRFSCVAERLTGNTWVFSGTGAFSNVATTTTFASEVALTNALDRVRLTTVGGTDQFDAGSVNISWE